MGNKPVNPIIIIAAIVGVVILIGYFGWKAALPPQPPAGSYTPGVPPWLDKSSPTYGKAPSAPPQPGG